MTEKEVGELRRRLRPDRTNITAVCGCYVSDSREILSRFRQSVGLMTEEDKEHYLTLLKRVSSGTPDKNRLDIAFRTAQVADSDEHRLLMALRDTRLTDEQVLERFYEKINSTVRMEGHYLILLAHESYDVPFRSSDGAGSDDSEEVFSYVLCAVCPVKPAKSAFGYCAVEKLFHDRSAGWVAACPEAGFLFPAFDDRKTNIYNALYYTKSSSDTHPELIAALFRVSPPQPADSQRAAFGTILGDALQEECSLAVVQSVNDELRERIEIHKQTKSQEPLEICREDVNGVLRECGVSDAHLEAFGKEFDKSFGEDAFVSPRNLAQTRQTELKLPDVVIRVSPDRNDLIETRTIGGVPYLLIRADEGVEVNGVQVHIGE